MQLAHGAWSRLGLRLVEHADWVETVTVAVVVLCRPYLGGRELRLESALLVVSCRQHVIVLRHDKVGSFKDLVTLGEG